MQDQAGRVSAVGCKEMAHEALVLGPTGDAGGTAWPITLRRDLLSQASDSIWHPKEDMWSLHVWPLSSVHQ